MVARNNITGDKIQSKGVLTKQGEDNWDLIFDKKKKVTESDWDESRIDTIGQNGNDGEHYDKVEGLTSTSDKPVEPT